MVKERGYDDPRSHAQSDRGRVFQRAGCDLAVAVQAQCFLETSFWESLGRTLGWEGDFEYITLRGDEPRKVRQPMWLYYWHRFNPTTTFDIATLTFSWYLLPYTHHNPRR